MDPMHLSTFSVLRQTQLACILTAFRRQPSSSKSSSIVGSWAEYMLLTVNLDYSWGLVSLAALDKNP